MNNNSVSIGPSTLAGWGTALTAFLGAVIAYLTGDHTAQSVTAVELAGIGALSGGITQLGRYFQAHKNTPVTEILSHIEDVTNSKSSDTILTEISKISHDIASIIKDPKSLENFSQDEEIAHDIDTLATGAVPATPDGDNSKVTLGSATSGVVVAQTFTGSTTSPVGPPSSYQESIQTSELNQAPLPTTPNAGG